MNTTGTHIGIRKAAKFSLIPWCIWELVWMVRETEGDFANGILFFMHYHFVYPIFWMYAIMMITILVVGALAGVMINSRNSIYVVSIICILITSAVFVGMIYFFAGENPYLFLTGSKGIAISIGVLMAVTWPLICRSIAKARGLLH